MNLDAIQKRIFDLMTQKKHFETQYKQIEQQLFMLQGHINELEHQMRLIINPTPEEHRVIEESANVETQGKDEENAVEERK